jgi:crotonyl-CoA reductase
MKAWVIKRDSANTKLIERPSISIEMEDVDIPHIHNDNEVLVRIKSSSVNFNTVWSCLRRPKDPFSLLADHIRRNPSDKHHNLDYFIPGSDASGIVVQIGAAVIDFKEGDEVIIHCGVISDSDCTLPDPMLSKSQSIWGYETNYGAFAEYTIVKSSQLLKKPKNLDFISAGSNLLTLGTAYRMLISDNGLKIKKSETCLIWGASGGLGVFAIQICLAVGAIPVCVVSDENKAQFCRAIGAKHIIICDRKSQNSFIDQSGKPIYMNWRKFSQQLHNELGEDRVDCVFEHIGKSVFALSIFMLKRGGRLVTCAATSGFDALIDIRFVWMEMKRIIGSHFCNPNEAKEALNMLSLGEIKHSPSEIINFSDIPDGLDSLYHGNSKGKLAIAF